MEYDELIKEYAKSLEIIRTSGTFGDYTFEGILADFTRRLLELQGHVYVVYNMQADSWNGTPFVVSTHHTLEGAEMAIPENCKKLEREPFGDWIKHYSYFGIKKVEVK